MSVAAILGACVDTKRKRTLEPQDQLAMKRAKLRERQIDAAIRERQRLQSAEARRRVEEKERRLTASAQRAVHDVLAPRPMLDQFARRLQKALQLSTPAPDDAPDARELDALDGHLQCLAEREAYRERLVAHGHLLDLLVPGVTVLYGVQTRRGWVFEHWSMWDGVVTIHASSETFDPTETKVHARFDYRLRDCNVGRFHFRQSRDAHDKKSVDVLDPTLACIEHAKHLYQNATCALLKPLNRIVPLLRIIFGYLHSSLLYPTLQSATVDVLNV